MPQNAPSLLHRSENRSADQMRSFSFEPFPTRHAEGSCLVSFGLTKVLCTATIEDQVPRFLKGKGQGWVTAEYAMLPRSTHHRMQREITKGKPSGRTQEIQRLIGRSLRACIDLKALGERQVIIDCDVLQADGGTRTAAINGGFVAMALAIKHLIDCRVLLSNPIKYAIGAISCGLVDSEVLVDLDYYEDSNAEADGNFVMTKEGLLVEAQTTAEDVPIPVDRFQTMLSLAIPAISVICEKQQAAILSAKRPGY